MGIPKRAVDWAELKEKSWMPFAAFMAILIEEHGSHHR
jgi:hypothetical protein